MRATFPLSSIVIDEDNATLQFGLLSLIKVTKLSSLLEIWNDVSFDKLLVPRCETKAADFFLKNRVRLKYQPSFMASLKQLTRIHLKLLEKRFSLIPSTGRRFASLL